MGETIVEHRFSGIQRMKIPDRLLSLLSKASFHRRVVFEQPGLMVNSKNSDLVLLQYFINNPVVAA